MKFNVNDFQKRQSLLASLLEDPKKISRLDERGEDCLLHIIRKRYRQQTLKPYQAELIKLQRHLEQEAQPMIVLFEGRDASAGNRRRRPTLCALGDAEVLTAKT